MGYIGEAVASGYIAGNGSFTKRCCELIEKEPGFSKVLLTTSCTSALEMSAILADVKPGDEVIVPAYTFVSTALAFARQGAKIVFADSREDHPGIDEEKLEGLVTEKTKVIVPVHYGGRVCDMDKIMTVARKHHLIVAEDAAHAFGSYYRGKPAGTIGHLGCFSFHETKVIHCGEGGMISVNDEKYRERAEVIWEKGTDRCAFRKGEVPFYVWRDTGSSFLMSDLNAAFLLGQLENAGEIISRRKKQWELYYELLKPAEKRGFIKLPPPPVDDGFNYYTFYILTGKNTERDTLKEALNSSGIQAITHYFNLAVSPYAAKMGWNGTDKEFAMCNMYAERLLRLPLYYGLGEDAISEIAYRIIAIYEGIS